MDPDKRKAYRKQPDGTFTEVPFRDLKQGDVFKLEEPDGEMVEGGKEFVARSDAKPPEMKPPRSLDSPPPDPRSVGRWFIEVDLPEPTRAG